MQVTRAVSLFSIAASLLAGCGGGGGGGDTPPPTANPTVTSTNARTAWRSLLSTTRVLTASGVGSDSANYQLSMTIQPLGSATSRGIRMQGIGFTSVLTRNSLANNSSTFNLFVLDGTGVPSAYIELPNDCSWFTGGSEPPILAALGQSGPLYSGTLGSISFDCLLTFSGTVSGTWVVQSEGSSTFFCVTARRQGLVSTARQESCIEVTDATGTLGARVRFTLTQGTAAPLVLRNY